MIRDYLAIDQLKPHEDNPRTISKKKFNKLKKSIANFPDMLAARPIVINENKEIIGGNMRFLACKELGITTVPVIIVNWSIERQREFMVKDNISLGSWDLDKLFNEWEPEEIKQWDIPVVHEVMLDLFDTQEITFRLNQKEADFVTSELGKFGVNLEHALLKLLKYNE
jgi:hypothetical protein